MPSARKVRTCDASADPSVGFDCSGLMLYAYNGAGVALPRVSRNQFRTGRKVPISDLRPGDLVFYGEPVSHVGMYIGNDEIINAPQTGEVVSIKTMWYSRKPMTFGRVP